MANLKTWKDCIANFKSFYYINSFAIIRKVNNLKFLYENCVPSKELAEKLLTFQKLITCREAYVGDWKPNWNNCNIPKYVIVVFQNNLDISGHYEANKSFSFPDKKMAEEFLKNFKSDLEFVKDLL